MAEKKYTIIEYHSHGGGIQLPELRGLGPFGGDETEMESSDEEFTEESEAEEEEGGGNGLQLLVALVLLVGIAIAVNRFRGGDEEAVEYDSEGIEVTEYED